MDEEAEHPWCKHAKSLLTCIYLINLPTLHKVFPSQHLSSKGERVK